MPVKIIQSTPLAYAYPLLIKQLLHTPRGPVLRAAHPDYPDMHIKPEQDFSIWGVVKWSVHQV